MVKVYRNYYHHSDGRSTNFLKVGENKWWCTHGDWEGKVKEDDELTLHHFHGKAIYSHYEEYEEEIDDIVRTLDNTFDGLNDWEDDIAF